MLSSQLCVFDVKTDSESKWVKNSQYGSVIQIVYFVKILMFDALSQ